MYIGQTVQGLTKRKQEHITAVKDNMYFHCALRKYGIENFDWETLHDGIYSYDELNRLEIYYIGYYDTYNNGYNLTLGGGGNAGYKHSVETKKKMSKANKGKNNPMYNVHRVGKDHPMYGKKHSAEAVKKMSEAHKGKKLSSETKKKMSESQKGNNYGKTQAVIINNKHFDTRNEAADFLGITSPSLRYRIIHKTKWLDYSYA